jgi:hypothetical protein
MKIGLIIPSYKQSKYVFNILDGISKQSIKPDCIYFVIDRPEDDKGPLDHNGNPLESFDAIDYIYRNVDKFPNLNVKVLQFDAPKTTVRTDSPYFFAGIARNVGVREAINDNCDLFVFIDGDCIPQPKLIESHRMNCNNTLPILSVGKRLEQQYRWSDKREVELPQLDLFNTKGTLINNPELLKKSLVVWSCNIALNRSAVNRLMKFNNIYYNKEEVFASLFDGEWGGEDSFLGIEAWYCRIFINTIGIKGAGVTHTHHPRPSHSHSINHKKYFDDQIEILRKKVVVNPLRLTFFNS